MQIPGSLQIELGRSLAEIDSLKTITSTLKSEISELRVTNLDLERALKNTVMITGAVVFLYGG